MASLSDLISVLRLDDFSGDTCQGYLNEPDGLFCEKSLNVDTRLLTAITSSIEEIRLNDTSDSLDIKRMAAFLVSVLANAHDTNGDDFPRIFTND